MEENNDGNGNGQSKLVAQMTIRLLENGKAEVQGPFDNPSIYFALLAAGFNVFSQYQLNVQQHQQSRIVVPNLTLMPRKVQ